jgi:hypothetical protein
MSTNVKRAARSERPGRSRGLVRCGVGLAGLRLADDDLRAVERETIELQVEALAVAVGPNGADRAAVSLLAALGHGVNTWLGGLSLMVDGSGSRGCWIFGRLLPVRIVRERGAIFHLPSGVAVQAEAALHIHAAGGVFADPSSPVISKRNLGSKAILHMRSPTQKQLALNVEFAWRRPPPVSRDSGAASIGAIPR